MLKGSTGDKYDCKSVFLCCDDPSEMPLAIEPNTRGSSYEGDGRELTGEYRGRKPSAAIGYREGGSGIVAILESGCKDGSKNGGGSCLVLIGDTLVGIGLVIF